MSVMQSGFPSSASSASSALSLSLADCARRFGGSAVCNVRRTPLPLILVNTAAPHPSTIDAHHSRRQTHARSICAQHGALTGGQVRAFRRPHRRRRHFRRGRRLSPDEAVSRAPASSCSRRRRASAAPGSPIAIPASAPTATSTPSAIASSRGGASRSRPPPRSSAYMGEVIDENGLGPHIRYRHKIPSARWSSAANAGPSRATRTDTGETVRFTAELPLDVPGLLPPRRGLHAALAGHGDVQGPDRPSADLARRTSTTRASASSSSAPAPPRRRSSRDRRRMRPRHHAAALADIFHRRRATPMSWPRSSANSRSSENWIHEIVRRKILHDQGAFTRRAFAEPEAVKQELLAGVRAHLGPDYDIETHFTPKYRPWRQRIAFVPDGDLFQGITLRQGLGGHRRNRALHRNRHPAQIRPGSSTPTSSSPPPAST